MRWIALAALAGAMAMKDSKSVFLSPADMEFLEELTSAVLDESRVAPGEKVGGIGPNLSGVGVIRPGGRDCYPAFWVRDYAMSLESGLVKPEEQRDMLLLTAQHQQDEPLLLPTGSIVPSGSIPDHVSFSDKPIFFPGTLEDHEGQGGSRWGRLPCLDDAFFFIHMAACYVRDTGDKAILDQPVGGRRLLQRLEEAYRMPPSRQDTGVVYAEPDRRGISFGFTDTVVHTGDLLFSSVLKFRAAQELAELCKLHKDDKATRHFAQEAKKLRKAIGPTFEHSSGLLRASTGESSQPDVWGTAFAVYLGALQHRHENAACRSLAQAYQAGTISWRGNIRHVPTTADFSETTAWEVTDVPKNRYQNGAYWGTPTGWVAYALARVDFASAARLAQEYLAELREGDFRKGPEFGSPWECMHPEGNHRQNAVYLTSVTCPLAAFCRIQKESAAN